MDTNSNAFANTHRRTHAVEEVYETLKEDKDGIRDSLDRLCQLVGETENTVYSEDAETIILDLQRTLDLLLKAEDQSAKDRKGKRRRESHESDTDDDLLERQREVKRMKSLLTTSQSIAVNGKRSRPWTVELGKFESKKAHYQVKSETGTITVRTRRRRRIASPSPLASPEDWHGDAIEVWDAYFAFSPDGPQNAQIAVAFQQQILHQGSFLTKPVLSVSALLPNNSKVFRLIETGDLEGLIKSLSLREACLTDRDSEGRCLLNYALFNTQLEICKYLIDQGVDVDFIEPDHDESEKVHSLQTKIVNDCEEAPEGLILVNQCRRLLLEAGADPSQFGNDYCDSLLETVLLMGTKESLRLLLDHGDAYIQTSDVLRPGLFLSKHFSGRSWTLETVTLLLRRSEIGGIPRQNLFDCLFQAIKGSFYAHIDGLRDVLILLIKAGADVFTRRGDRNTVSDIACNPYFQWSDGSYLRGEGYRFRSGENHDLLLKEIWSEALSACGFDAEKVISDSLRGEDLSDSTDEDMSYEEEGSLDESDRSIIEDLDDASDISNYVFDYEHQVQDDQPLRQTNPTSANQYEQSLLEGDAQVWRS